MECEAMFSINFLFFYNTELYSEKNWNNEPRNLKIAFTTKTFAEGWTQGVKLI